MGAKSYIVRGLGNRESFMSCSHGAGRKIRRAATKKPFTLADHAAAPAYVEWRKDEGVLDEMPGAYKAIDDEGAQEESRRDRPHAAPGPLRRGPIKSNCADSDGSRPGFRDDVAHHSDLISPGVPR